MQRDRIFPIKCGQQRGSTSARILSDPEIEAVCRTSDRLNSPRQNGFSFRDCSLTTSSGTGINWVEYNKPHHVHEILFLAHPRQRHLRAHHPHVSVTGARHQIQLRRGKLNYGRLGISGVRTNVRQPVCAVKVWSGLQITSQTPGRPCYTRGPCSGKRLRISYGSASVATTLADLST